MSGLTEQFQKFVAENNLFSSNAKLLLAVSGGIDSVVMTHLFKASEYNFAIAHCNFELRGEESIKDVEFVKSLAKECQVDFFSISFPTQQVAAKRKQSIQLVARDLRYEWLEKIRSIHEFSCIATAHHADDNIETFLYNWSKGTSIRGMTGIPLKNGHIIRPLLFTGKIEIENYATENGIAFRADASNAEDKYARNKIRHHVIPTLKELNPGLISTSKRNFDHARATQYWFERAIQQKKQELWQEENNEIRIITKSLLGIPFLSTLFFEWLSPYGLNSSQAEQLASTLNGLSGSQFITNTHRILVDRDQLLIQSNADQSASNDIQIQFELSELLLPSGRKLVFTHLKRKIGEEYPRFSMDQNTAYLELSRCDFPLKLRRWKSGDIFQPLGMNGKHQKIQDFFVNRKLSRFDKEKVWLLENRAGEICWIVGMRISENFRLKDDTEEFIKIEFREISERQDLRL